MNTGNGKQKNQQDVRPSEALENLINSSTQENPPKTTGTGSNQPVPTKDSLIIRDEDAEDDQ